MTNRPIGEPEQRWQQPSFGPAPEREGHPLQPRESIAAWTGAIPPPSPLESVVDALAKLAGPLCVLVAIFNSAYFIPLLMIAFLASGVFGALRRNYRRRRHYLRPKH